MLLPCPSTGLLEALKDLARLFKWFEGSYKAGGTPWGWGSSPAASWERAGRFFFQPKDPFFPIHLNLMGNFERGRGSQQPSGLEPAPSGSPLLEEGPASDGPKGCWLEKGCWLGKGCWPTLLIVWGDALPPTLFRRPASTPGGHPSPRSSWRRCSPATRSHAKATSRGYAASPAASKIYHLLHNLFF